MIGENENHVAASEAHKQLEILFLITVQRRKSDNLILAVPVLLHYGMFDTASVRMRRCEGHLAETSSCEPAGRSRACPACGFMLLTGLKRTWSPGATQYSTAAPCERW